MDVLATNTRVPALLAVAMAGDGQPLLYITDEGKFADEGCPVAIAKAGWWVCNLATKIDNDH